MTYYISGPMKGVVGHNYPAFERATAALRGMGLRAVSPHEFFPPPGGDIVIDAAERLQRLRRDVRELAKCDNIVLLPGWSKSRGAKLELMTALELDMGVHFFTDSANGALLFSVGDALINIA